EGECRVLLDVRFDLGRVDLGDMLVGHQHHDEIGTLDRIGHGGDFELGLADLIPGRPALADTDGDLAARVAEVQRMGMPLRTVADDGDLLALDELDVAVLVVEDLHLIPRWCSDFEYAFTARNSRCASADGFENRRLVASI